MSLRSRRNDLASGLVESCRAFAPSTDNVCSVSARSFLYMMSPSLKTSPVTLLTKILLVVRIKKIYDSKSVISRTTCRSVNTGRDSRQLPHWFPLFNLLRVYLEELVQVLGDSDAFPAHPDRRFEQLGPVQVSEHVVRQLVTSDFARDGDGQRTLWTNEWLS